MTAITLVLLSTALFGFAVSSPLELRMVADTGIIPSADNEVNYRLGRDVVPTRYDIKLTPYFEDNGVNKAFTFDGFVTITVKSQVDQLNSIVLHAYKLDIKNYRVDTVTIPSVNLAMGNSFNNATYDETTEKWTINLTSPLPRDQMAVLEVNYIGHMLDDMNGFYRSYYKENGQEVWLGSTQFQQTESRRAFPSFDEPGFKSVFKLMIDHPNDMHVISNTIGTFAPSTTGRLLTTFADTPMMSSYLLAFVVSKFDHDQNTAKDFGVIARPDAVKANATNLALTFGEEMLEQFGLKLGFNYSQMMTKMDTAAIPDFSAGAMENWGLLTYRETLSLYYPQDTPSLNEQRIVAVIAHEQAHQWFGDLVTCNWWSETWLNEGHARYFQYFGTKMVDGYKDWDLEEQFVVENHHQSMLSIDGLDSTHPMTDKTVATKAQSSGIFDNISYNKAASIIRMMSYILRGSDTNEDKFYEVLGHYLEQNQYKAVEQEQYFLAYEQKYPGSNISKIFGDWAQTPGFPLVTAKLDDKTLTLNQKRFMRDSGINNAKTELYNIPITYMIDSATPNTKVDNMFYKEYENEMKLELPKKPEKYYILNAMQIGYFRVNYDNENWMKLREALYSGPNHDGIHVLNRAQIVDDLFQLARAGTVEYKFAIDIIRYIRNEIDYIPWLTAINNGLTHLSQRVKLDEKQQELFSWFIKNTTETIYDHLDFVEPKSTDKRTDIYNRVNILNWACKYGHEDCIAKSKEHFEKYMKGTKVHKDLRATVYCNAIRYGDDAAYNYLDAQYAKTDIMQEQLTILSGLACTKNAGNAAKYLDRLMKTDEIRRQDWAGAQSNMLNANPESIDLFYNYITANHVAWKAKFGSLGYLTTLAGRFTSAEQFDKYAKFLSDNSATVGLEHAASLKEAMERVKGPNLQWDDEKMKKFMDYVEEISGATFTTFSVLLSTLTVTILYIFN